jgi:hypothetical protein
MIREVSANDLSQPLTLNGPQPGSHPSETLTILYGTWAEAMQQARADSAKQGTKMCNPLRNNAAPRAKTRATKLSRRSYLPKTLLMSPTFLWILGAWQSSFPKVVTAGIGSMFSRLARFSPGRALLRAGWWPPAL